jgi:myosin heavy subunit
VNYKTLRYLYYYTNTDGTVSKKICQKTNWKVVQADIALPNGMATKKWVPKAPPPPSVSLLNSLKVGDHVWIQHEEEAWLAGILIQMSSTTYDIRTQERGIIKVLISEINTKLELATDLFDVEVENLVDLGIFNYSIFLTHYHYLPFYVEELSEGSILYHVKKRFKRKIIYTHVGAILVAVNPFENLPIYTPEEMKRAQNAKINKIYPHVFVTAAVAYNQLMTHSKNQSVLISGESGAGKTETTKKVLSYLAKVAPSLTSNNNDRGIEDKILQSNPLLEALGNKRTNIY